MVGFWLMVLFVGWARFSPRCLSSLWSWWLRCVVLGLVHVVELESGSSFEEIESGLRIEGGIQICGFLVFLMRFFCGSIGFSFCSALLFVTWCYRDRSTLILFQWLPLISYEALAIVRTMETSYTLPLGVSEGWPVFQSLRSMLDLRTTRSHN